MIHSAGFSNHIARFFSRFLSLSLPPIRPAAALCMAPYTCTLRPIHAQGGIGSCAYLLAQEKGNAWWAEGAEQQR